MRLSHGFVRGERLACIYHGWQYDADGTCSQIPAHPKLDPPKTICAQTFGCHEADGVIWVTLGSTQDLPDPLGVSVPVRSMPIAARVEDIVVAFGGEKGAQRVELDRGIVLVQPVSGSFSMVHVLALEGQDRKDMSRWLEGRRQLIEEGAT